MRKAIVIAAALAACGKGDELGKDWSGVALDDTVTGSADKVKFEVKLPKGWKLDDAMKGGVSVMYRPDVKDYFSEPSVMISYSAIPPATLDEFIKDLMLDAKDVVEKKEASGDVMVVVTHTKNNGIARAQLFRKVGDKGITCRASQAKDGGVPNPPATMAWLEKVCRTLAVK